MRTCITVQRHRSSPNSHLVGHPAVGVLETLPGISEVTLDFEGLNRAVISYTWVDPGTHFEGIEAVLYAHGIQLV